jgi:uncharacterized membrane protein
MNPTNPEQLHNLVILLGFIGSLLAVFSLADFVHWAINKYRTRQRRIIRHYLGEF